MKEKNYEITETKQKAKDKAKQLFKCTYEVLSSELTKMFDENAPFAVEVSRDLLIIAKESVKGKSENQKEFIKLCNEVIKSCNNALEDDNISEEERLIIRENVLEITRRADESNKQYQKDKKEIAKTAIITGGAVASIVVVARAVLAALSKTKK